MAKEKRIYFCTECGWESPRWGGQCGACGAWNTLAEMKVAKTSTAARAAVREVNPPVPLTEIRDDERSRCPIGNAEWDRTLGGGIVPGSLMLVGGAPGVGKSTLIMQVAAAVAKQYGAVFYATGEESEAQVGMRAKRLGLLEAACYVQATASPTGIMNEARRLRARFLIIDSIQTMQAEDTDGLAGSVTQIKKCTELLLRFAKETGTAVIIIGHVTKEGVVAGPRMLEHMVDTVLYLEGEAGHPLRLLRATKNRFGDTSESGVFLMQANGLQPVSDLSRLLLAERSTDQIGTVVFAGLEGIRPMLAEVQALTNPTYYGNARRTAIGYDQNRLTVLLAVLEKKAGFALAQQDVYVNVAGGIRIDEPGMDLAVATAVISVYTETPVAATVAALGEVGLTGDVRRVQQVEKRLQELTQMGFRTVFLPAANLSGLEREKWSLRLIGIQHINEIASKLRGDL